MPEVFAFIHRKVCMSNSINFGRKYKSRVSDISYQVSSTLYVRHHGAISCLFSDAKRYREEVGPISGRSGFDRRHLPRRP